jgi:hypothetical protein
VRVLIEPLLPNVERHSTHPGPKQLDDQQVPQRILFVPRTGIRWDFLPRKLSSDSDGLPASAVGLASSRRLQGVLLAVLLVEPRGAHQWDYSRAVIDTQMCALRGRPSRPPARSTAPYQA